jgi:hypothetical protein
MNGYEDLMTLFGFTKFITIMFTILYPSFKEPTKEKLINFLHLNILEAIVFDIYNSCYLNVFLGIFVILSIPKHNTNKFKAWTVLYFIWNLSFCLNQQFSLSESLAHNLPAMLQTLTSFNYSFSSLIMNWGRVRTASLATVLLTKLIELIMIEVMNKIIVGCYV